MIIHVGLHLYDMVLVDSWRIFIERRNIFLTSCSDLYTCKDFQNILTRNEALHEPFTLSLYVLIYVENLLNEYM